MRPFRLSFAFAVAAAGVAAWASGALTGPPHHLDRALAAQRELAAQRPGDAGVHNDLGNLLELAGDRRGAEAAYQQALELDPEKVEARFNYGLLLLGEERRREALRQFRAVVDLDPGNAWAHYQIGRIYDSWGLERAARRAYARAFRIDPDLTDARINPDVVGNRDAIAAMLLAWQEGGAYASRVPREYAEGSRIAGLLIDVPAPPAAAAPEAVADDEHAAAEGAPEEEDSGGGFARLYGAQGGATSSAAEKEALNREREQEAKAREAEEDRYLTPEDLDPDAALNQVTTGGSGANGKPGRTPSPRTRTIMPPRYVGVPGSTGRLEPTLLPPDPERPSIG